MSISRVGRLRSCVVIALCCLPAIVSAQYIKTPVGEPEGTPPPDANKECFGCDASCWLATAANMLAGAGYGPDGWSVQDRADEIYRQLQFKFTTSG